MKFRTFIAIPMPMEIQDNIAGFQLELKKIGGRVKWVDPKNMHLTLKFLGDTEENLIPEISEELQGVVTKYSAFETTIDGLGAFPNFKRPRVIWIGAKDQDDKLHSLAKAIDKSMERLGFEREKRSFSAHLTLGRVKDPRSIRLIIEKLQQEDQFQAGKFLVDNVHLIKSELTRTGPIYTMLDKIKLTN